VQVNRPRADGAAARQGDLRPALARQQRPKHIEGRAHLAHQIIRGRGARQIGGPQAQPVAWLLLRVHAQMGQQMRHEARISQARHILQLEFTLRQKACRHQLQGRIFRTGDRNDTGKRLFSANDYAIHEAVLKTGEAKRQGACHVGWGLPLS
jgi:hypothetical protein